MRWEDLTPEQRDAMIRGLRLMLTMFKDWYRTGLMGKITPEALIRADGVFKDLVDLYPETPTVPVPPTTPPLPPQPQPEPTPAPIPPAPEPTPVPPPAPPVEPPVPDPAPPAQIAEYGKVLTVQPDYSLYDDTSKVFGDRKTNTTQWYIIPTLPGLKPPKGVSSFLGLVMKGKLVNE